MNNFKEKVYPRRIESYMGIDVWFNPISGKYYASHCEHTKKDLYIKEVKRWIKKHKN